ncbi:MAG: hypothetical protein RL422_1845 [Bacteroidota bacterium]|jgi:hypothetical protein
MFKFGIKKAALPLFLCFTDILTLLFELCALNFELCSLNFALWKSEAFL